MLTPEFSRPLFLKLLCESLKNRGTKHKSKYLRELASGQKGMTLVLEDFAKEVGKPIERDFQLKHLTCWRLLKGDTTSRGTPPVGIAPSMASGLNDHICMDESLDLIESFTSWKSRERCQALLQRMLADGLLTEGVSWENRQPTPVIQFPYQRFGDHLIARHLLDQHLNTTSEATVRRSFYAHRPLGRIFELAPGGHAYTMPGLAAAIMLEFPERVKRRLPPDERELVGYLPKGRQLAAPLRDVFLEGLYWRPSDSFTVQTEHVVNFYLNQRHEWTQHAVLEVLTSLATRPGHRFSAKWLYDRLAAMAMPERDLFWTEFLRGIYGDSPVHRLLAWIERTDGLPRDTDVVNNCFRLLALCLTSTRRGFRDRVTRAIYLLGLHHPQALFQSALLSLGLNDPYVPERMLAASYGVAMSVWLGPEGQAVRTELPVLAQRLARELFLPGGAYRTTHVLVQEYALGIISIARRIAPRCISRNDVRFVTRPLSTIPSPFPPADSIPEDEAESAESAFRMDFENYTLGRLVHGRGNYQYGHDGYRAVRRQILWRVADLGYSTERFSAADRSISYGAGHRDMNPAKVDRYGKKYSWIAFFEMYSLRHDAGELSEWSDSRPGDLDIDPSFPIPPQSWIPPTSNLLGSSPREPREWLTCGSAPDYKVLFCRDEVNGVEGPWLLLDGYIEEAAGSDDRRLFTFLWARLIEAENRASLLRAFWSRDYPGNDAIPPPAKDYHTFAGEIPWSPQFGNEFRTAEGQALAHVGEAFWQYSSSSPGIPVEVPVHEWVWGSRTTAR